MEVVCLNDILIAIIGIIGTLLSGVVMFIIGKRWERNRQTLIVRAEMLDPIKNWLKGVEKFTGILGDTLGSVSIASPGPLTYDLEERRKSAQFMIENTNEVLGILESGSLITKATKELAEELSRIIRELDIEIKYTLLPLDHEILDRGARGAINEGFVRRVGETKLKLEHKVQRAYLLIAKIKTQLS
jgi:hypothetical protein